jgi:hypothetical protein
VNFCARSQTYGCRDEITNGDERIGTMAVAALGFRYGHVEAGDLIPVNSILIQGHGIKCDDCSAT